MIFFEPADVFDAAILGIVGGFGQEPAVLYDESKVLEGFVAAGASWNDAREWFDSQTLGSYLGPATPRFLALAADLDA